MSSNFAALLGDLDTMLKADGDGGTALTTGTVKPDGDDGKDPGPDSPTLTKALQVTLPDGTMVEAFDGEEMLKALEARQADMMGEIQDTQGAFGSMVELIKRQGAQIAKQESLLKALNTQVERLAAAGTGRRAILNINEKPTAATVADTSADASPGEVMAKALNMARDGKLDWSWMSRIEAGQGRGEILPPELARRHPELLKA